MLAQVLWAIGQKREAIAEANGCIDLVAISALGAVKN